MKTLTAAIVCLILAVTSFAQYMAAAPVSANPTVSRVTLELKDTPLKSAIEQVVKFSSAEYRLDSALDGPPYDGIIVSIRLVNVPYYEALGSLLNAHELAVKVEDGVRIIQPAETPMVGAVYAKPDLVTMTIPRMPIAEALRHLYLDSGKPSTWRFQGRLDSAIMPGATFRQFPRDEAADVLLVAAGLVPPAGSEKLVRSAGAVNLSTLIAYVPLGSSLPYPLGMARDVAPGVAVAAYRTAKSPDPLLVVLANRERDIIVLDNVLAASGVNYVLGDMTGRPSPEAPAGPRLVSVRLCGVTLEQTLNSILPAVKLRYRMQGPTMVIESVP